MSAATDDADGAAAIAALWQRLRPEVWAGLAARVVVLGAESTGTTTLTQALADRLGVAWVPEYGRAYTAERPGGPTAPWRSDEFDHIVDRQIALEDAALRGLAAPLLLCDTDVLATALWHERYLDTPAPRLLERANSHRPDLYLLTGDEIPFVADGQRDGEHIRHAMQTRFRAVLATGEVPWLEVRGTVPERVALALPPIEAAIARRLALAPPLDQLTAGSRR